MIAKLKEMTRSRSGEWIISFSTPEDFTNSFDELVNKDVVVDIKRYRKNRSLDANAYCWALIGQIAERQGLPKNEVYRKEILEHGSYRVHCIADTEVEGACADWCSFGLGFQVEKFPSKIKGCTNVIFYKGSHFYDSAQMARLIQGIIQDAESIGIPTITDKEAEKLIGKWNKKETQTEKTVEK